MISMSQIRRTTKELLLNHDLFMAPIDLKKLTQKLNIEVIGEELDENISGFLVCKNGKSTVVLNKSHHKNRKRFTLAHEIGHFILHKGDDELFLEENLTY